MVAAHVHDHRTSKRFLTLISLIAMRNMTATATMMTATAANEFSNSAAKTVMMMTSTAANELSNSAATSKNASARATDAVLPPVLLFDAAPGTNN